MMIGLGYGVIWILVAIGFSIMLENYWGFEDALLILMATFLALFWPITLPFFAVVAIVHKVLS